jgi:hypothetical protein
VRPNFVASLVVLLAAAAAPAVAQVPFRLSSTQGNVTVNVQDSGTLNFTALIGQTQTAQIIATYTGTGTATITGPPVVFNSAVFATSTSAVTPVTLNPGQTFAFAIQFEPTSGAQEFGLISLSYTEQTAVTPAAPCLSAPAASICTTPGSITINVLGTAPSFVYSYVLQSTQNAVTLLPGAVAIFPPTQVATSAPAVFNITNNGTAAGVVSALSISTGPFKFAGIPVLPFTIPAGQNLQLQLTYQPTATTSDTGQIQLTIAGGPAVTFGLQGSGSSASLVYQVLQTGTPVTVAPGGTVALPNTAVGQTSSVTIRISNTGNANGTISTLAVSGPGFQLTSPPPLPVTVAPNASVSVTVTFAPTQGQAATGTLTINTDTLNLTGTGLGSQLVFSYTTSGTTVTIGTATPSVIFSPAAVSQSTQLVLDVKNTGTLATAISNIGIVQANSPFSIVGQVPLPVGLAPNADFQITLAFTPTALGFANGSIQFDATTIPLIGSGTPPPPLPAYTFTGPSGSVAPMSQPLIGLSLASAYPVAISGTLTMAISGSPVVDPAVQFSSGGLTVPFVIPANGTQAMFANQGSQIGLQSGTVASTITLTPSFATQAGSVSLTPATPTTLQFSIAPAAPTLISAEIGPVTTIGPATGSSLVTSSFVLTVTGFSVPRSLSSFSVQFTSASGFSLPTAPFTVGLTQLSSAWFQSSASTAFGGQFSLAIPFTFQGSPPSGQTLLNGIGAISVSVTNSVGASNTLQVN